MPRERARRRQGLGRSAPTTHSCVSFRSAWANARIAVIRLEDMITTQIVNSDLLVSNHGGTFVTPNTE